MSVPFRLIAIVGDVQGIDRALKLARSLPALGVGVMARDPQHRPEQVERLVRALIDRDPPSNVTPIANSRAVAGIRYIHLTSVQLAALGAAVRIEGLQPDVAAARLAGGDVRQVFGVSAHGVDEVRTAQALGAAYVTVSPIFPTRSKPGHAGISLAGLRDAVAATRLPVFALGGVTPESIPLCLGAGAYGVAGISMMDMIDPVAPWLPMIQ